MTKSWRTEASFHIAKLFSNEVASSALIFVDQNTERKMFMFRIVSVVLATLLGPAADSPFQDAC